MSRGPHTFSTSSRAITCHCGCIASNTVVHVSKLDVVCSPAKKKLLHSSAMSRAVMAAAGAVAGYIFSDSFNSDFELNISRIRSGSATVSRTVGPNHTKNVGPKKKIEIDHLLEEKIFFFLLFYIIFHTIIVSGI
ncbi:hypothetical protein Hanom_Chr05g00412221 [Helianthus anomalus]